MRCALVTGVQTCALPIYDDGGEDMKPATGCIIAATLALAFAVPSAAVEVDNLDAFKQHFGRYAPGGDCGKQPQIVVSHSGFAFEGGPALPAATRPDYMAKSEEHTSELQSLMRISYAVFC